MKGPEESKNVADFWFYPLSRMTLNQMANIYSGLVWNQKISPISETLLFLGKFIYQYLQRSEILNISLK